MDAAATDELRALRARAYGPDADIHTDEDALRRLHELEQGPGEAAEPALVADAEPEASDAEEEVAEPEDARPPASRGSLWRLLSSNWRVTLWVATLAVAVLMVTAGLVLVQRVQADPLQVGAHQVARLAIDPRYEVPEFFGPGMPGSAGPQGFEDFYGVRAVRTPGIYEARHPASACFSVFDSGAIDDTRADYISGWMYGGCTAGPFPASTQFLVTSDMPDALLARFPEGSALQFVYDGDSRELVVFSDVE